MGYEIEKKFIVVNDSYKKMAKGELYVQGFLSTNPGRMVRVRISKDKAWLTIKGLLKGALRQEFEYEIPLKDAKVMLNDMCQKPVIKKYRYKIEQGSLLWEVDEFLDENKGLVIAEIELEFENQSIELPDWIGKEVTGDERYYNAYLANFPFTSWK